MVGVVTMANPALRDRDVMDMCELLGSTVMSSGRAVPEAILLGAASVICMAELG